MGQRRDEQRWVLIGGSGHLGSELSRRLVADGRDVTVIDRLAPRPELAGVVDWRPTDLLVDDIVVPEGFVVVLVGTAEPYPPWPWTLALDNAVPAARLAPELAGRPVLLVSSAEVYGSAAGPLNEATEPLLPWTLDVLDGWCDDLRRAAGEAMPPWRAASLCRRLADADPSGRWVYGLSKLAQERLLGGGDLSVVRLGNVVGPGQYRVVTELAGAAFAQRPLHVRGRTVRSFVGIDDVIDGLTAALPLGVTNLGGCSIELGQVAALVRSSLGAHELAIVDVGAPEIDSAGEIDSSRYLAMGHRFRGLEAVVAETVRALACRGPVECRPPVPVVVPPRPARPDVVADRQSAALWRGALKAGQRWSTELAARVKNDLVGSSDREVLLTTSGTAALRLAVAATAGPARAGQFAVAPSYTFPATVEVLVQLGYRIRYADVSPGSWTLDPASVATALAAGDVGVVVTVDTFGAPSDYSSLLGVCRSAGVPLVADSAAAFGSSLRGLPIALQADAHAFSFSFAKALVAGGSGGAVVLPQGAELEVRAGWDRSELMGELHAVAGLDQLDVFPEVLAKRTQLADLYGCEFAAVPGVTLQRLRPGEVSSWTHFVVRIGGGRRGELAASLDRLGIGTKPYFPALHRSGWPGHEPSDLPVTERLHEEALALPISSELAPRTVRQIAAAVRQLLLDPPGHA